MTTFREKAAHSVDHMASLCSILTICKSFFSRFGFEVLIAPVPGHSLLVTFMVRVRAEDGYSYMLS